jgi:uncharacterized membrane protein
MKTFKLILTYIMGAFMVYAGVNHFLKPAIYLPFISQSLPQMAIVYLSGIVEILLGVGVFIPKFRDISTKGIFILMLLFLPLHIRDVFVDNPAVGSHQIAIIRLPIQFVLIAWTWFIQRKNSSQ